ncbi:11680_t:CDS:1 [Funneliformis geosporum]|uniref:10746_t:CDS:1 n=1 Tax=Funneliformis geosporum TaxID=1117311 RepID=A0A9W4SD82_9GLOM|nr:11680_t:CDS:1 [Funneliformis geosporum]CAI2164102.1 10746_t:CDS:1 [Funneliformis geosporum]
MEVRTEFQNEGPPLDPLKDLKDNIINQINQKMAADPKIKTSELKDENQNYKDDIQKATQKNQINGIYNELKADIETKRDKKKLAASFQKLISQAQQARQTDNSSSLAQLLMQIYNYQGDSGLYSQYESEIKQWETYLNQQGANAFKDLKINAINDLLQQEPKVTITELKEKSRDFQRIISQTSDFTKLNQFESRVRDNVFEVRTEKKFSQLLTSAQNAKSEEEKSLVTQQVYK